MDRELGQFTTWWAIARCDSQFLADGGDSFGHKIIPCGIHERDTRWFNFPDVCGSICQSVTLTMLSCRVTSLNHELGVSFAQGKSKNAQPSNMQTGIRSVGNWGSICVRSGQGKVGIQSIFKIILSRLSIRIRNVCSVHPTYTQVLSVRQLGFDIVCLMVAILKLACCQYRVDCHSVFFGCAGHEV